MNKFSLLRAFAGRTEFAVAGVPMLLGYVGGAAVFDPSPASSSLLGAIACSLAVVIPFSLTPAIRPTARDLAAERMQRLSAHERAAALKAGVDLERRWRRQATAVIICYCILPEILGLALGMSHARHLL